MNKIKIRIPEQTIEVNYEIESGVQLVTPEPIEPSTPTPASITKPEPVISVGIQNITDEFNNMVADGAEAFNYQGSTYEVKAIKRQNLNRPFTLKGNDTTIIFGKENYDKWNDPAQDSSLFHLMDGAKFYSEGINYCQPKQIINVEPWMPTLFSSVQNPDAQWSAIVKDCDTTKMGRNGGFGLGTLYGSNKGNLVGAINYKHLGNGFIEGKASIGDNVGGILKVYLNDVMTDGSNEEEFGSNRLLVKGFVKNNVFTITSEHKTNFLFNHFFNSDKGDNYAHILHIGRFTFMIDDIESIIDDKRIKLRPNADGVTRIRLIDGKIYTPQRESHAGDLIGHIAMNEKWRDEHPVWSNNFNPKGSEIAYHPYLIPLSTAGLSDNMSVMWISSWDQEGVEQDAYLISKGNDFFRTYPHTEFGKSWEVLRGMVMGHNMYNHQQITLYAENVVQKGYYRQTSRTGKSLGYFMTNCQGFKDEFNYSGEIKSQVMSLDEFSRI